MTLYAQAIGFSSNLSICVRSKEGSKSLVRYASATRRHKRLHGVSCVSLDILVPSVGSNDRYLILAHLRIRLQGLPSNPYSKSDTKKSWQPLVSRSSESKFENFHEKERPLRHVFIIRSIRYQKRIHISASQHRTPCSFATLYISFTILSTSVFFNGTLCPPSHSTSVTPFLSQY